MIPSCSATIPCNWLDEYVKSKQYASSMTWVPWLPGDSLDYSGPNGDHSDSQLGSDEDRDQVIAVTLENLSCLLELPLGYFLSHLACNDGLHVFLDSFLRYHERWFDRTAWMRAFELHQGRGSSSVAISPRIESLALVTKRVFAIFQRVAIALGGRFHSPANRESQGPPDSNELKSLFEGSSDPAGALGEELGKRIVISVEYVIDVCTIYGGHNVREVQVIMNTFMQKIKGLESSLCDRLGAMRGLWSKIRESCSASDGAQVEDLTKYLLDITVTLERLKESGIQNVTVALFPKQQLSDNLAALCKCYEHAMPRVFAHVVAASASAMRVSGSESDFAMDITNQFHFSYWRSKVVQKGLLSLVYGALSEYYFAPLSNEVSCDAAQVSDALFHDLQQLFSEHGLSGLALGDMYSTLNVSSAFAKMASGPHFKKFDTAQFEYAKSVLASLPVSPQVLVPKKFMSKSDKPEDVDTSLVDPADTHDKAIQSLREFLPHLGPYFSKRLLMAVNWSVEQAVQCVLENTLPVAVRDIDFCQEEENTEGLVPLNKGPDSMSALLNQVAKPPIGARGDEEAKYSEIDDQETNEELQEIRARIKQFAAKYDEYEDEYDDAYEDNVIVYDAGTSFEAEGIVARKEDAKASQEADKVSSQKTKQKEKSIAQEDGHNSNKHKTKLNSKTTSSSITEGKKSKPNPKPVPQWKPGMVDVDGIKRDINGKRIVEDETDLLKPNKNRHVPGPIQPAARSFGRGGTRNVSARNSKPSAQRTSNDAVQPGGTDPSPVTEQRQRSKNEKQKSSRANHNRKRDAAKKASKGMFS